MARKVRPLAAVAATAILGASAGAAASHELNCWPRERVLAIAREHMGQVPAYAAVVDAGKLLEILLSPDGGFTAGIVYPNGLFCPFSDGEGWRAAPPTLPGREG